MRMLGLIVLLLTTRVNAQELFPLTEPASNMPSHSIGLRLNNEYMVKNSLMPDRYRLNPELMWGISKSIMVHLNGYFSNMHQSAFKGEGGSVYVKWRFISVDDIQSHFRVAAYGKASSINNRITYQDINLSGDNSGYGSGIVVTQLLHKLAVSFTGGYIKVSNNLNDQFPNSQSTSAYNYSLSAGYLVLPKKYNSYDQVNLNVYTELLGKSISPTGEYYLDLAPGIQFIVKSKMRIDLTYRKQLAGNMFRIGREFAGIKFEYNLFSAY